MGKKLLLAALIATVVACYFVFDGQRYLSVELFRQLYRDNPLLSAGGFFLLYYLAAAFSLPAAALLTVIAGMIFGLFTGTVLVSFASAAGATTACFFSRYLFRDWVQRSLGRYLERINRGLEKDGASYLFTLRLIPVFPFWVINLVFGITRLPLLRFYLVSQAGMLPGTLVYVNAGAQLGQVEELSVRGVLTPAVIGSFLLLAVFPYLVKGAMGWWQRRKVYTGFEKPARFDTNMLVIGAGSAGLVAAYLAAALKAGVTLVEKDKMGGDCLNTGCVPSKALLRAARAAQEVRQAGKLGIDAGEPRVDFPRVMAHVHGAIDRIAPHDSVERYAELGVNCVSGRARLVSPWDVDIDGTTISARTIVIATGARPRVPDLPGLDGIDYLTSENLWSLEQLPGRLLVVGGGPVGCEMAQAFQRLGSSVTVVQRRDRLLPQADADASRELETVLRREGVEVMTGAEVIGFQVAEGGMTAQVGIEGRNHSIGFDRVLLALGRQANTEDLGLESLNIPVNGDGTVQVDGYLRTRFPHIFACGDVAGPFQFTHASSHQAWYAAVNGLFGHVWKFRADYRLIPSVTYTDPEVAGVGLTEELARNQGVDYEVTCYSLDELDRAVTDGARGGFIKILTRRGKDSILGATIVGPHGGEMLMEFITAMKNRKGLNAILSTIHPYPVFSEGNKLAAGQWKRAHTPEKLLRGLGKYHRWRLGK